MIPQQSLISVILSFRNEEDVIPELIRRLSMTLSRLTIDYELIFVNDASTDQSLSILLQRAQEDQHIKIINMSRRFGVSECVIAGMHYAKGDAIIYLDADLQDPPELIPQLIEKWQEGFDVVHTVRLKRKGESAFKLLLTDWAYQLIGAFADISLLPEAGDFKLLSKRAVEALLQLPEKTPYLRGLVSWVGFKQTTIPYIREARAAGTTKFPLFRYIFHDLSNLRGPIGTFIIGLTSFSLLPIMIFLIIGALLFVGAILTCIILLVFTLMKNSQPIWVWLLTFIMVLAGGQFLGIGVLGIYLSRVYQDVRGRPAYIVESLIGFQQESK